MTWLAVRRRPGLHERRKLVETSAATLCACAPRLARSPCLHVSQLSACDALQRSRPQWPRSIRAVSLVTLRGCGVQVIEDKTFGLKNKNKSKAVQRYVQEVTKGAKMAGMSKDEYDRKQRDAENRQAKKSEKKDREAEMRLLFAPAISKKQKEAERLKKEAEEAAAKKVEEEGPEIVSAQDAYNDAKREAELARAEAILGQDQDDDIYTQIEKKRSELKKFGGQIIDGVLKPLTPVSYDSFVAWKERKDKERRARELEESRVAAMKAAKEMRGKSGRDLMAQLAALGNVFEDDDEADDDWMVREKDSDDEEVFDIQVTGTTFSLKKAGAKGEGAAAAGGDGESEGAGRTAGTEDHETGAPAAGVDTLAGAVDASLFLDDDVDLPSDDDDE